MKRIIYSIYFFILPVMLISGNAIAQEKFISPSTLRKIFQSPPESAKPWVFWYWMQAAVSKEGITRDLEAMKSAGIGGAYLMSIKGPADPPLMEPPVVQLTPEWWGMVKYAMHEANRLGIHLAMHVSDGFALAGGPWITSELSMQKIVWTEQQVEGGATFNDTLQQPETNEGYYEDIAVFAYPSSTGSPMPASTTVPKVTASKPDSGIQRLADPDNKKNFSCKKDCWIQYEFEKPFTCRSIIIHSRNNYQSNRLLLQVSNDGKTFHTLKRLEPPRSGWQDWDADYTHSIPATTARFFRFIYDKSGSEPGAEDLDAAKWKPSLKLTAIELSGKPRIHQYEGKSGQVWRISKRTSSQQVPDSICVPLKSIIDITKYLDSNGHLIWNIPLGNWTILRMGHTSTDHRNDTGGGGKGLECDKFNPRAVTLQFNKWFGEAVKQAGPELARSVLSIFHVDSWECGSQNWSPLFREAFRHRRGYDLLPYLPVMAGIPVGSADVSERFLYDVRQTIAELINDNFYATLAKLAHEKGVAFSAESVAPTMLSDGMLHYQHADIPMGEFWLRSPTHDKPNDMLDAISGAHIYGKPVVQAEAFTELRLAWDEYPGMLKTLQDRNYALGINRLVYHVFMHNPWIDHKPGMSLDGIGLFFQRDQTWWKPGRAWVEYAQRCQALLQVGHPVTDIAVFTGEELPRRSVLPDRLVQTLPGVFGNDVVEREAKRLANVGEPLMQSPKGVTHSANMADPSDWVDPLHGYAYDSYNSDALIRLSKTNNGRIDLPGGASYSLLVIPASRRMSPDATLMSAEVAVHLQRLIEDGATVLICESPQHSPGLKDKEAADKTVLAFGKMLEEKNVGNNTDTKHANGAILNIGEGHVIKGPFIQSTFEMVGLEPDFICKDPDGKRSDDIAWTHRSAPGLDIYFISNQQDRKRTLHVSLRVEGRIPELWDAVTGNISETKTWRLEKGRTMLPIRLEPAGSVFIILQKATINKAQNKGKNWLETKPVLELNNKWQIIFDPHSGGPEKPVPFTTLADWSKNSDAAIRYYSGTADYTTTFMWKGSGQQPEKVWLNLGKVANIAEVTINGIFCGVAWTAPFRVDISKAIHKGKNNVSIEITNTWANRLIGDHQLAEEKRITKTNAPYRLQRSPLLPAGLFGPVVLEVEKK